MGIGLSHRSNDDSAGQPIPPAYAFAPLLDRGPVRVSAPVAAGMEKAVKLATSLGFSVKIIPGQPEADQVMQLIRLADFYLRNPTIDPRFAIDEGLRIFYIEKPR